MVHFHQSSKILMTNSTALRSSTSLIGHNRFRTLHSKKEEFWTRLSWSFQSSFKQSKKYLLRSWPRRLIKISCAMSKRHCAARWRGGFKLSPFGFKGESLCHCVESVKARILPLACFLLTYFYLLTCLVGWL